MNISSLRYFVKVAYCKNISKAAQELFISQPALSRHLQRLEAEIGTTLFERSRGKITCQLTEVGNQCLYDAERILVHVDHIYAATAEFKSGEHGTLTIGFGGLEARWLFELIRQIGIAYPKIKVELRQFNWGELGEEIANDRIDMGILVSGLPYPGEEFFQYIHLAPSHPQIIASKSHPFSDRKYVTVDDLKGEHFIGYDKEIAPGYSKAFQKLCMKHGFLPDFIRTYGNSRLIWNDIYSNLGIGIYDSSAQKLDDKEFSQIDILLDDEDPWPDTNVSIVYHRDNMNPCLQTVIRLIPGVSKDLEFNNK